MAAYSLENPAATTEATSALDPVAEPYKPKRKTRRSRRGAYRRKQQQLKRLAEEAAADTICDTSTSCTESETSSSEATTTSYGNPNGSSPQRCARRRNDRKNYNGHRSKTNIPFQNCGQQPMHHGYNHPNMYACENYYTPRQGYYSNHHHFIPQQVPVEVRTLSKAQQDQYIGLDCEMVGIGSDGLQSALARVTIIDWHGNCLMDEYVKQKKKVTDYRTFVSGITKEILDEAQMDFNTCRQRVQELLKGKILVGHALKNDLSVLNINHPWHMIRDTAMYEPFMKIRFNDGILWPRALRDLCRERLNRTVQVYGKPHCPHEDALAALDLYRTVWQSWEQLMEHKMRKATMASM